MSALDNQLVSVREAVNEFLAEATVSALPDEMQPSVLMLSYQPTQQENAGCQIVGDAHVLVQVLVQGAAQNEALRDALIDHLPQLLALADY